MAENHADEYLLIDDIFESPIDEMEGEALKPIQRKFMESYVAYKDQMAVEEWLPMELKANLPKKTDVEITEISTDILNTLKMSEAKKTLLDQAIANGRSKESWFASEVKTAISAMSAQEASQYLANLDKALNTANESLYRTISTQAGIVSRNPRLEGFIAEQYHAQTFNLNAEASGSPYRAKVLEPTGNGYTKNSVDLVIVDGNGKVVRRYQSKYCKDAASTQRAFEHGDYRGQQSLVPVEQSADIQRKNTPVIEAPDGTQSTSLTKTSAKQLRDEAQSGKWNDLNWNEYRAKDLALGVGKQAGQAALMGAAIGVGFNVAQKVWNGEKIDGEAVIETALTTGTDFGIKAAAAGALKVGVERGIITVIPKGTPAGTIANIAFVAVENVKVLRKMVTGELTVKEGLDKMEQVTVSTVAGLATSIKGATIGAAVGSVFGPVGTAVGGFIGGTVGYMAGSKVGDAVVKTAQKIRDKTIEVAKSIGAAVTTGAKSLCSGVKNFFSGILSW